MKAPHFSKKRTWYSTTGLGKGTDQSKGRDTQRARHGLTKEYTCYSILEIPNIIKGRHSLLKPCWAPWVGEGASLDFETHEGADPIDRSAGRLIRPSAPTLT